jgi:hypothetical protein
MTPEIALLRRFHTTSTQFGRSQVEKADAQRLT